MAGRFRNGARKIGAGPLALAPAPPAAPSGASGPDHPRWSGVDADGRRRALPREYDPNTIPLL